MKPVVWQERAAAPSCPVLPAREGFEADKRELASVTFMLPWEADGELAAGLGACVSQEACCPHQCRDCLRSQPLSGLNCARPEHSEDLRNIFSLLPGIKIPTLPGCSCVETLHRVSLL